MCWCGLISNGVTLVMCDLLLQFKVGQKLILTLNGELFVFPNSCFKYLRTVAYNIPFHRLILLIF